MSAPLIFRKSLLLGCLPIFASIATATAAFADDQEFPETVVVTGTRFNTDAAPAKASLETTEPQTIINKSYIENYVPPQSDYVTILAIVPSMTGGDINGPGLSDGGTKNTLRGFGDGMFVQTYDGIPFGDTNGPTHHNISYFPASTIGSLVVDRGPGNAGTLGASTYGGSVNFFSEGLTDGMQARALASWGSFNTYTETLNTQSGDLSDLGAGGLRAMANLQEMDSGGALTGQDVHTKNMLLKFQDEIAPHWTITLFGDASFLKENLDDNNGLTPDQVADFGKNFALQNVNPNLPTYSHYNYTSKWTDMDYLRENGELFGVTIENTSYTYNYWNHTFSPNSQSQVCTNEVHGTCAPGADQALSGGAGGGPTSADNLGLTLANGTTDPNGLLAYSKENSYRAYGDILRLSEDYDLGWVHGQVREGVWWETQATHRFKYFYDDIACDAAGVDPFVLGDAAANAACGAEDKPFAPSTGPSSFTGPLGPDTNPQTKISKAKSIEVGDLGFAKDDERSDWTQYQPFVEMDIMALSDRLTITPGLKYVHWDHGVSAPAEQGNLCGVGAGSQNTGGVCPNNFGQNFTEGFITRDLLPFLTANYKIEPSWSVYFQYANGIYVPDISSFENGTPTAANGFPTPEKTTNYQLGTVYYADQFTFDADYYYIQVNNNLIPEQCSFDSSETCDVNDGAATYQGIEGEGTYAFDDLFGMDARGLSMFANGALMSSKQGNTIIPFGSTTPVSIHGNWEPGAPMWTAAGGVIYARDHWRFSLIEKIVGPQWEEITNAPIDRLQSYGDMSGTIGYSYDRFELVLNADNLMNSRKTTLITINDATPVAKSQLLTSTNQYFFQPPRSFFLTLKVHL